MLGEVVVQQCDNKHNKAEDEGKWALGLEKNMFMKEIQM